MIPILFFSLKTISFVKTIFILGFSIWIGPDGPETCMLQTCDHATLYSLADTQRHPTDVLRECAAQHDAREQLNLVFGAKSDERWKKSPKSIKTTILGRKKHFLWGQRPDTLCL
jgi:hypothetical protein